MRVVLQGSVPVQAQVVHVAWPRVYAANEHELHAIDSDKRHVAWTVSDELTDHPEPYGNARFTFIDPDNHVWVNDHWSVLVRMSNLKRGVVLRGYDLEDGSHLWERALDEHPRKGRRISGLAASLIRDGNALRVAFSNYFADAHHMTIVHRVHARTGEDMGRHVIDRWAFFAGMHDDHRFVVDHRELVRIDSWDEPFEDTTLFESRMPLHFVPSFWKGNVVVSWHDGRGRIGVTAMTRGGEIVTESRWKRTGVKSTQVSVSRDELILHVNAQTFMRLDDRLEPMWEARSKPHVQSFMASRRGPFIVGHHFQVFDRDTGELLRKERATTPFGVGDCQWIGASDLLLFRFGREWRIADAHAGTIHDDALPEGTWHAGPTATVVGSVKDGIAFADVTG